MRNVNRHTFSPQSRQDSEPVRDRAHRFRTKIASPFSPSIASFSRRIDVADHHLCAVPRKQNRCRATNATAPAGDENDPARKVESLIHAFVVAYFDVVVATDFTQRNPR
jgi:hypothetical protein